MTEDERASYEAMREERDQYRAEMEAADALTQKKIEEIELIWSQRREFKQRAEAAEATVARLAAKVREALECRNGASHYCPNCDNSIDAEAIIRRAALSASPTGENSSKEPR